MARGNNAASTICDGRKRFAPDGGAIDRAAAWAAALSDLALPGTGMFIAAGLKDLADGMAVMLTTFISRVLAITETASPDPAPRG